MVMEFRFGLMAQSMRETGAITKPMERVSSGMQMETFMTEIGKMIKPTVKESMYM